MDEPNVAILNWYNSLNDHTYQNSLFFKGPLLYSDPQVSDLVTPVLSRECFKNRAKNTLLELDHKGDPENWDDSKFLVNEIQGIRKSSRLRKS